MHLIKIVNKNLNNYSSQEKILLFIDIIKNSDWLKDENCIKLVNHILKNVLHQEKYKKRLSVIMNTFLSYKIHHQYKLLLIDCLLSMKAKLNFSCYSIKNKVHLGENLFEAIQTSNLKENEKLKYYKKLLKWIVSQCDINQVLSNETGRLISFFTANKPDKYKSLIYHIALNAPKYNIDLMNDYNLFFRRLFWNYDDEKNIVSLRKKIIKNISLEQTQQTFKYELIDKDNETLNDIFFYYSEEKTIKYLFDNRKDLTNENDFNINSLLKNPKISLSYKKEILNQYKNTHSLLDLPGILISFTELNNVIKTEKECAEFFNYCIQNFKCQKENLKKINATANHVLCNLSEFGHILPLKEFIFHLNEEHKPNGRSNYPLHELVMGTIINQKTLNQVIELMKDFKAQGLNFNCQNRYNNTPLHLAIKGHKNVLEIESLILHGAKVNIKNKYGKTPYDYALTHPHFEKIKDLIMAHYEKEKLEEMIENDERLKIKEKLKNKI